MVQIREILRLWVRRIALRQIERLTKINRKTVTRYVEEAKARGLKQGCGEDQITDELVAEVTEAVRPGRRDGAGHKESWQVLEEKKDLIEKWLKQGLKVTKVRNLLGRRTGRDIPYRTLHRFCVQELHYGDGEVTVRLADGEPGSELQIDFGRLGLMFDPFTKRRRAVWALIFTGVYSRHMFVWLSFTQTLEDVINGCEAAWNFFGGIFKVVIPDNLKPVIDYADPTSPRINDGFLEYAQQRGFVIDAARVGRPKDKARVERMVPFVRDAFFKGEEFFDLPQAQARAEKWCLGEAGMRSHGTTRKRPLEVFEAQELMHLGPAPEEPYDIPAWSEPKVHKDFHIIVGNALYSVPYELIGQRVKARADSKLVKVFHKGHLIKVHPRKGAGDRSSDPNDYPEDKRAYATRDLGHLLKTAQNQGPSIGAYVKRLLDSPLPWTKMRQIYKLLSLARRHGPQVVDQACNKALELDVVDVYLIDKMVENPGSEKAPEQRKQDSNVVPFRFARLPEDFASKGEGQ